MLSCLFSVNLITAVKPYKTYGRNKEEIAHEAVIMTLMYHLLCCSDFIEDFKVRNQIGYSMIVVTLLHLAVYFGLQIYIGVRKGIRVTKRHFILTRARQASKEKYEGMHGRYLAKRNELAVNPLEVSGSVS